MRHLVWNKVRVSFTCEGGYLEADRGVQEPVILSRQGADRALLLLLLTGELLRLWIYTRIQGPVGMPKKYGFSLWMKIESRRSHFFYNFPERSDLQGKIL